MQFFVRRSGQHLRITRPNGSLVRLLPITPSALTPVTLANLPEPDAIHVTVGEQRVVFQADTPDTAAALRSMLQFA